MNYQGAPTSMDHQAQRPSSRPRSKSSFSLRSGKSEKSTLSNPLGKPKPKVKLGGTETELDKRRKRLSDKTYADPSRAIMEAQPATRNMLEGSTLAPIRSVQHKDVYGNLIDDPDTSNPTRARMERPLDTIRSFEAAIDAGYKRRNPMGRTETAPDVLQSEYSASRRSSIVDEGMGGPRHGYRGSHGGHHGHSGYGQHPHYRASPLRQTSHQERYGQGPNPYGPQGRGQRMSSAPVAHRNHSDFGVYNNHAYHESYDTVQTGDSTGSSEPWSNSTNPSSENSSVDRMQHFKGGDAYGVNHGGNSHGPSQMNNYVNNYGNNYGPVSPIEGSIPEDFQRNDYGQHGGYRSGDKTPPFRARTPSDIMKGMNQQPPPQSMHPQQPMMDQQNRNMIRLGEPQPPRQQMQPQSHWQPQPNQGMYPPPQMNSNRPPPPAKDRAPPGRQGSKLQRQYRGPAPGPPADDKGKRKSWFKRIF